MRICPRSRPACFCGLALMIFLLAACETQPPVATATPVPGARTIGHAHLGVDRIPLATLDQVRTLDVYFEHASVGSNILAGIEDLSLADSRYAVNIHDMADNDYQVAAWHTEVFGTQDGLVFNARGNPGFSSKVSGFDARLRATVTGTAALFGTLPDVTGFKFCYIDNDFAGYGNDIPAAFAATRTSMEALESAFPACTIFWTTMPICSDGDADRDAWNTLVRQYCASGNRWLLDIADIESHNTAGTALTDSQGREYMDASYTDDGGHLNEVGRLRVAKAWWYLLARISGWEG